MKWPTMDEFAQMVADKAIDEIEYNGKTIRQWIEIILATDINVATKDGTNLAELGTDCISREQACDALEDAEDAFGYLTRDWREVLMELPPIQPKRGKWELTDLGAVGVFDSCSECKRVVKHKAQFYNFCPNCGADMRQKGENNESN